MWRGRRGRAPDYENGHGEDEGERGDGEEGVEKGGALVVGGFDTPTDLFE